MMAVLTKLAATIITIIGFPIVSLIAFALGLWAIWAKPAPMKQESPVAPKPEPQETVVAAPIDYNRVPIGRMDKGGIC